MSINIHIEGNGKPLVLFHGWGFDLEVWRPIIPFLANNFKLFLVDLPGFGLTTYMPWNEFKLKLLKKLPLKFAIAGWSMGGLLATKLALEEDRVTHLINITSSPYFIKEDNWPGVKLKVFNSFYENLTTNYQQTLIDFVRLQLQGENHNEIKIPKVSIVEGLKSGLDLLASCDLRESLLQLKIPALYLFGRLDAITPWRTMISMRQLYPNFNYYLFDDAAHVPFLSNKECFKNLLEEFLQ